MYYPKQKMLCLAVASACATFTMPGYAQETAVVPAAARAAADAAPQVQTVVVSGLRNSLGSSMNLKRSSDGIVDGIVAADIGKFPDTNLAESLQRITGVSIDRSIGEGSKVTVRGVGPDFTMVLLNGRQMATSNLGDRNGRAFDFANLASEAISQIQVYKTSRAETPPGGIGATINVMTARPLDAPGFRSSVGVKLVHDTSNDNLPGDIKASSSTTPEVSGIFSNTFADGKFGIALSASYQERNLGFNQASVPGGWRGPFRGDENAWGSIPADPATPGVTNHPKPGDLYQTPQNLLYSMNGVKRQRTNGQLTLQFKPIKDLVTTLDYTHSQNKIQTKRAELSAWMNFGPSTSSWTDGPVAAPLLYKELIPSGTNDIAMAGAMYATKTKNDALGFNAAWRVSNDLKLEFDAHRSVAESTPDSPYGSCNGLGAASHSRGDTGIDFSKEFPVLSITGADFTKAPPQVTGSTFQNGYMKGEVAQQQIKGRLKIFEASNLNFGVAATKVNNRSAFSNQQQDSWGGATKTADYPDSSIWHRESLRQYFDKLDGSDNPALFNQFNTFNFEQVRALAAKNSSNPAIYMPKTTYDTDQRTEEKSKAAFLQVNSHWDTRLPIHTAIGLRYEKTDVVSTALVPTATSITMNSANEFSVGFAAPSFTTLTGTYNHILPSVDFDVDVRSDMKVRASYGVTIGRPRYDQIAGGQILNNQVRIDGGTGSQGNPALKPVKSKNLDLSYEWYYSKQSYLSAGYFRKDLENYAGVSLRNETPFNLRTPVGGALWNEAVASGCANDTVCIRNFIFRNRSTAPGVTRGADDGSGNATGSIVGQPNDPIANFRITTVSNQKKASLYGAEVNLQHMFGNTGFGMQANYTYVKSDLVYNNASIGEQFALEGLSDSANLVAIYEDTKWTVRAAYNWRDKFLSGRFDGVGPNPNYVEPYGQVDVNVSYAFNDKLSLQFEVINATDSTERVHGRNERQALYVTQGGPRYMLGARYKF